MGVWVSTLPASTCVETSFPGCTGWEERAPVHTCQRAACRSPWAHSPHRRNAPQDGPYEVAGGTGWRGRGKQWRVNSRSCWYIYLGSQLHWVRCPCDRSAKQSNKKVNEKDCHYTNRRARACRVSHLKLALRLKKKNTGAELIISQLMLKRVREGERGEHVGAWMCVCLSVCSCTPTLLRVPEGDSTHAM